MDRAPLAPRVFPSPAVSFEKKQSGTHRGKIATCDASRAKRPQNDAALDHVDFYDHECGVKNRREAVMRLVQTLIRRDPWDVEPFLRQMNMTVLGLRRVRDVALTERGNATAFHPRNSPGTFAYHHGVWALRDQFVGDHYKAECPGGVEAIVAADMSVRVSFANVDRCCDAAHSPVPVSHKGAGVERLCEANLFGDSLPTYTRQDAAMGIPLYYAMVDLDGRIELSQPTIVGKTFGPCIERNFISLGGDNDGGGTKMSRPNEDGPVDLAPTITRKVA